MITKPKRKIIKDSIEPMETIRTDLEFVSAFYPSVSDKYEEAKRLYQDIPTHTLVTLRGICSTITNEELESYGVAPFKKQLAYRIRYLEKLGGAKNVTAALYQIKDTCNKGAHSEDYSLTDDEYIELAKDALKETCGLISLLHQNISESDTGLEYHFVESVKPLLKDLLYEAVFKKDIESQIKLGNMLASSEFDDAGYSASETEESNYCYNPDPLQRKLAYQILNDAVKENSIEGMFTLGKLLSLRGGLSLHDTDEKNQPDFERLLKTAADAGHFEAKALFGTQVLFRLDGKLCSEGKSYEKYKQEALKYVQEVSVESAICQELLGELYKEGHLLTQDIKKSCYYYKQAADNGRRVSQYEFALLSEKDGDIKSFEKYIKESADNGYKPAILEVLSDSNRGYDERVKIFDSYKYFDINDNGSMASFDLNTEIEFVYSQLVCSEMKDSKRVMSAILLLNNYLSKYEHSIGDLKLGKLLNTMGRAVNYCREHAKGVTLHDMQNFMLSVAMLDQRIDQLNEKNKAKWVREQQHRAQIQNNNARKKVMLSAPINKKVGRNETCPYCDSGKKFKLCCRL